MANTTNYRVLYRVGGRDRCRWDKVWVLYPTRDEANSMARSIEKQGYRAVVMTNHQLQTVGAPIGWESDDVNQGWVDEYGWWNRFTDEELAQAEVDAGVAGRSCATCLTRQAIEGTEHLRAGPVCQKCIELVSEEELAEAGLL